MLGLTVVGSMFATHLLDAHVWASPDIYKHHFICASCYRLNGTNEGSLNYMRVLCYNCGKNLVIFERSFYQAKEDLKTAFGFADPTGVLSSMVTIVDGAAAGNLSSIAKGSVSLASVGISHKLGLDKSKIDNTLRTMDIIEEIFEHLKAQKEASEMSVHHLYPYLDEEDVMEVINNRIDCISYCKNTDTRLVRSTIAAVDTVGLSLITLPFDFLKATTAMAAGGAKTIVEGGNFGENCDEAMDDMGGWTTYQVATALQKFVDDAED